MAIDLPTAAGKRLQHVYLVQPPIGGGPADVTPPLALLLLGAILEAEGRTPHVLDLNLLGKTAGFDTERSLRPQLVAGLPKGDVDCIAVTTWSYNFDVTMEFVEEARKRHKTVPIILGGPHVTFVDEEVLATFSDCVDYIIRDEGEKTFPMLLAALDAGAPPEALAAIPGLTWRRDGEIVRNPSGSVNEALDDLPYPAYHLIDVADYLACQPVLVVEAGRGCPYGCNFCSTTNMFQRKYRVKTPKRLVDELEWLIPRTGTNRFELLHDNLVASKKYVIALCQEIRSRNLDVDWSCTSRTDNITEELAEEMFLAGCNQVFFGVETLDPERQKWTGKRLKPEWVHEAIELTARQHIRPSVGIVVGFPDESDEELNTIISAALGWATDPGINADISTGLLRYYPGADLFKQKDSLRYDPLAAVEATAVPGYSIRSKWKSLAALFPLQSIHTPPAETKTNILRAQFVRALMAACPMTARACVSWGGYSPTGLLARLAGSQKTFRFLTHRDTSLLWNETLKAFGDLLRADHGKNSPLLELLSWEAPFWETNAVAEALDELEHVIHPTQWVHEDLVARTLGTREAEPRPSTGVSIVGVRAGKEVAVWVTAKPDSVIQAFEDQLKQLRARS